MHADNFNDLVRPVAWIAALGFATGFCGYLALGLHAVGVAG